ncbi:gastrula zinc finger protein XlCGF57.1-like [Armigeres subalbatus]|uniref:gastrula zinc finger protein XlCGF57.1-like n=1 Tax=Armigeres subalbatus TaxID=124917 RepID=UPI002ED62693
MELSQEINPTSLCRVCIQDVTCLPSEDIFESTSTESLNIHSKLKAICSEVFSADAEQKPLFNEAMALPTNVCSDCKYKIDEAYALHLMCIESNRKLWKLMTTTVETVIKEEIEDIIDIEPNHLQLNAVFLENLDELSVKQELAEIQETSKVTIKKPRKPALKSENPGLPKLYQCERCPVSTNLMGHMHKHMRYKHTHDAFQCSKCSAAFFDEAKLEEHKIIHTLDKPFPCPNCKKGFRTPYQIKAHINICTGQTPFLCTECGRSFAYRASLSQHVARHKEKSFYCPQCPSKFHMKGSLKSHMATHTTERKFRCESCGSGFQTSNALQRHMMCHTDERPYLCDLCSLKFRKIDHLRRHMRTHTGEKPYKCTHCDRAFSQSNDLVKHSKTHFGDNPYKCDRCDEAFRLMTELRNHYKVHYQSGNGQETSKNAETFKFTIVNILNRRAEQEKKLGKKSGGRNRDRMEQQILEDQPENSMEAVNKS